MPLLECDGGKASLRWVETTCNPSGKTAWNGGGMATVYVSSADILYKEEIQSRACVE